MPLCGPELLCCERERMRLESYRVLSSVSQVYVDLGLTCEQRASRTAGAGARREQRVVQLVERVQLLEQHEQPDDIRCRRRRHRASVQLMEHVIRRFECVCLAR